MIALTSELHWARLAAIVVTAMSLLTVSLTFSRHDDRMNWSGDLTRRQNATKSFSVPVQFDDARADLWRGLLDVAPRTCHTPGYC